MKSRHDRVRASVLAVVVVISAAGWATAQQIYNADASKADASKAVKGSGTAGTIPLWTGSNTIGNSSITQSGRT